MSVLEQLQKYSQDGQGVPVEPFGISSNPQEMQGMEEMMQANAIPGQSLTQDPENRMPYETPPEFTDVNEFVEEVFLRLTNEQVLPKILESMRQQVPVEHVAEKFLMRAFQKGMITPDVLMLSIEPTIYILLALATYAHIDPVLYPEDEMQDDDEEGANLYKEASRSLLKDTDEGAEDDGRLTVDEVQAPSVTPRSLLARAKEAVGGQDELT